MIESGADNVRVVDVLQRSPGELAELPEFFGRLSDRQLDTAWVACIVECLATGERPSTAALADCLNTVRDRYRAARASAEPFSREVPASAQRAARRQTQPAPRRQPRRSGPELIQLAVGLAPNVGDEIKIREVADSETELSYLRAALTTCKHFEWIKGNRQRPGVLRRIAV